MKRVLLFILAIALVVFLMASLMACSGDEPETTAFETTDSTPVTTTPVTTKEELVNGLPNYVDGKLFIIEEGKTNYQVVFPQGANNKNTNAGKLFTESLSAFRKAFKNYGFQMISIQNDAIPLGQEESFEASAYEILLGETNREESKITDDLAFNEAVIRVVGKKVVISGNSNIATAMAIIEFIERYMPEDGKAVLLPADLNEVVTVDLDDCGATDLTYAAMAKEVFDSFNDAYWTNEGIYTDFWHQAEMIETYADVYEHTRSAEDKAKLLAFADGFIKKRGTSWLGNMYNDDVMWICIAFSRITQLTGEAKYAKIAKLNFDQIYKRAYDQKLGGGLYWSTDNKTKNSCVNCPAVIAACLISDIYDDESYFEKAKSLMAWEIEVLYEKSTGRVYDAININEGKDGYMSSYNQGTFIGACTLLYQKTKDATYLTYAEKAANFAMSKLVKNGVLDNNENTGNDNPGFKGIFVRWLYRYAKETGNLDILAFLQNNAAVAYQNRNKDGLIWTKWVEKTSDDTSGYLVFGMSTAISLMYNCQQWW